MPKEETIKPDDFTKAFGEDFWERPTQERFLMLLKRCASVSNLSTNKKTEKEEK